MQRNLRTSIAVLKRLDIDKRLINYKQKLWLAI